MTSKSIDGKDRCALHCCLRSEYKPIAFRRLSKPSELMDFSPDPPPLRPPSTSRASVRSKGKAALAVALGGRSAFYSPTLGHLGMIRRIFPWFQASGTTWGHSCYHNLPSFSPGTEELGTVGREKSATSTGFSVTRHPFTGSSPRCVGHTSSATQSVSPTVAAIY